LTWKIKRLFKKIFSTILIVLLLVGATMVYMKISYPLGYLDLIKKYSKEYNVDPYLVAAIINVESRYDKEAISSKKARGLMQISPTTGEWAAQELAIEDFTLEKLFEPEINIRIGTWYLKVLSEEFDNNLQLILAAYNGGSGNVSKWLGNKDYSKDGLVLSKIPFKETEEYIKKVERNLKIYRIIYKSQFNKRSLYGENYLIGFMHNFRKIIKTLITYK
jgi:soluble lytic murein transglycosylase